MGRKLGSQTSASSPSSTSDSLEVLMCRAWSGRDVLIVATVFRECLECVGCVFDIVAHPPSICAQGERTHGMSSGAHQHVEIPLRICSSFQQAVTRELCWRGTQTLDVRMGVTRIHPTT